MFYNKKQPLDVLIRTSQLKIEDAIPHQHMDIKVKKKLLWAILFSTGFTVFLLLQVEWNHFSLIAGRLDTTDFIIAFLLYSLANLIRSLRFQKIDYMGNNLTHWWIVNHIYSFITATIPGGAGEAATAYLLKRFSTFNVLSGFRLLVLTRLMDLAMYSALLLATALLIGKTTAYRETALWISGVLFFFSLIISYPRSERSLIRLVQRVPAKGKIMDRVRERLEDIANVSEEKSGWKLYLITMLQTALMIICAALGVHFMLRAFGTGFMLIQSFYCLSIYTLFQMVPVQGIAGIGTQAAWWTLALTVAGYTAPDAVALGIVLHGTFYAVITVLGFFALLIGMGIRKSG